VSERPEIILDGAHNPGGIRALVAYIRRFYAQRPTWIVYGAMRDKAVGEMASMLFPLAERVIFTAPQNSRAIDPAEIPAAGATITGTVDEALSLIRQAPADHVVFITGSLFVVGEARSRFVQ